MDEYTQPIAIDTSPSQVQTPIVIDTGQPTTPILDQQGTAIRAAKVSYGTQNVIPKSFGDIYSTLADGREDALRKEVSSTLDVQKNDSLMRQAAAGPITPEFVQQFNTKQNPGTVFEEQFSKEYMKALYGRIMEDPEGNGSWLEAAIQQLPKHLAVAVEQGTNLVARRQYLMTLRENLESEIKNQRTALFAADWMKLNVLPYYYQIQMRNSLKALGLGSNLAEERLELLKKPFPEFKSTIDTIVKNMKQSYPDGYGGESGGNPQLARAYLDEMITQTTDNKTLNNIMTAIDAISIPGLGALGRKIFLTRPQQALVNTTKEAVSGMVQSVSHLDATSPMYKAFVDSGETEVHQIKAVAAEAAGNTHEAGIQKTVSRTIANIGKGKDPTKQMLDELLSVQRTDAHEWNAVPGRMGQEVANRIEENSQNLIADLTRAADNVMKVNRTPGVQALETVSRAVNDQIVNANLYKGIRNSIMDIQKPLWNKASNSYTQDIVIGRESGQLFGSYTEAANFARTRGLEGESAVPRVQGGGYVLRHRVPWVETSDTVRDHLLVPTGNKPPENMLSVATDWLKSPERTLAAEENMNRKIAVYTPSNFMKLYKDNMRDAAVAYSRFRGNNFWTVVDNKGKWDQFTRAVDYSKDAIDPATNLKGYWFKNAEELESHYMVMYNRLPDPIEYEGYRQIVSMHETDRFLRNLATHKFLTRLGTQQHSVSFMPTKSNSGKMVESPFFNAVGRNQYPVGLNDTIFIVDGGKPRLARTHNMSTKAVEELRSKVETGEIKMLEIVDPDSHPLRGFSKVGDERVRYVAAKTIKTKELGFDNIPRRGGPHIEYDYDHMVKQADMLPENIAGSKKDIYRGDKTMWAVDNPIMAEAQVKDANVVIRLLAKGEKQAAKDYFMNSKNMPMGWDEFYKQTKWRTQADGTKIPPHINLKEDFRVVPKGATIIDLDKTLEKRYTWTDKDGNVHSSFEDGTRHGSLMRNYLLEYTGERDAYNLMGSRDIGTHYNPVFTYEPAKTLDTVSVTNRALRRMINSYAMDDYKWSAIEHWLELASNGLDAKAGEIRHSPAYWFYKGDFKSNYPLASWTDENGVRHMGKSELNAARFAAQELIGRPSKIDQGLHSLAQKLDNYMYKQLGPGDEITRATVLAPAWALAHLTDGAKILRTAAYHTIVGALTLPQIFVQAATHVLIAGIFGRHAISGMLGGFLHQLTRLNSSPQFINYLDKVATAKFSDYGWKPGQWKEAREMLLAGGTQNVGPEHSMLSYNLSPKVIPNVGSEVLDAANVFFNEGERATRFSSWFSAYREHAHNNKILGPMGQDDGRQILQRADMAAGQMSKASKSTLQMGPLSFTTQFLGYTMRVAGMMMGKSLTWPEWIRTVSVMGALFGIPTVASTVTGLPIGDYIRKAALERGYNLETSSNLGKFFMEGGLAYTANIASGNWYNIGPRYGNWGLSTIQEAIDQEKPIWSIVAGAPGSMVTNAWKDTNGFRQAMISMIQGKPNGYQLTVDDALEPFKIFSAISDMNRTKATIQMGKWVSRNNVVMSDKDVTAKNALFMWGLGLQPQEVADIKAMRMTNKSEKQSADDGSKLAAMSIRRWMVELKAGNDSEAQKHLNNAYWYLEMSGMRQEDWAKAITQAAGDRDLLSAVKDTFYLKAAQPRRDKAIETYQEMNK